MIVAGMGGAVLMAADRRSSGAQLDDQTIELKVSAAATEKFPDAHLNVTSYNGIVLLTGEAPTAAARGGITQIAEKTDRVRSVQNEMVVGPNSDFGNRSNDSFITSKVKARLVEADKVPANLIKVVTERGVVYLRGLVTPPGRRRRGVDRRDDGRRPPRGQGLRVHERRLVTGAATGAAPPRLEDKVATAANALAAHRAAAAAAGLDQRRVRPAASRPRQPTSTPRAARAPRSSSR